MRQIYNVAIYIFSFLIKVSSIFNSKSRKLLNGQQTTLDTLNKSYEGDFVWIHAASLGEFEQGKPLIESISSGFPGL